MKNKEYQEAIYTLSKATEIDPDYYQVLKNNSYYYHLILIPPQAYFYTGVAYQNLGDHATALPLFDKVLSLDSNYASALNKRGISLFFLHKKDQAIESLMKAKELDPNNPEVYSNLGTSDLTKFKTEQSYIIIQYSAIPLYHLQR